MKECIYYVVVGRNDPRDNPSLGELLEEVLDVRIANNENVLIGIMLLIVEGFLELVYRADIPHEVDNVKPRAGQSTRTLSKPCPLPS